MSPRAAPATMARSSASVSARPSRFAAISDGTASSARFMPGACSAARKLSPFGSRATPSPSAIVCPRSANDARVPRRAGRIAGPNASSGTCSRVWSVPGVVGSLPWSAVMNTASLGAQRGFQLGQPAIELDQRAREARRRRCGGRRPCRSRPGSRTAGRGPASPAPPASGAGRRRFPSLCIEKVSPRPAKMSEILPMPTTDWPAPRMWSSSVGAGGTSEKSRRL